ncbi:MAG TPA: hypothetical protein VI138_03705, partial [Candidatus Dormibacteraeota bacterium]
MPSNHPRDTTSARTKSKARPEAAVLFAILAVCSAVIGAIAWAHPTTTTASLPYTQSGRLGYSAPTDPGSVYGSAGLSTGRPIYSSVVSQLAVSYRYQFQVAGTASLHGTEQLVARISNGEGITRTIPIQAAATPFSGSGFSAHGTLSMAALTSAAVAFDQVAGTQPGSGSYTVSISPQVQVHGQVGEQGLRTTFNRAVTFSYSGGTMVPASAGSTTGAPTAASFAPRSTGSLTLPAGKPATLFLGLTVSDVRIGALGILLAALILLGIVGWPLLREANSDDEGERIAARHGSLVVEADALEPHQGVVVVQVGSFDGLLQVARRLECPILHWEDFGHVYAV